LETPCFNQTFGKNDQFWTKIGQVQSRLFCRYGTCSEGTKTHNKKTNLLALIELGNLLIILLENVTDWEAAKGPDWSSSQAAIATQ